jgi:hypothetical protein
MKRTGWEPCLNRDGRRLLVFHRPNGAALGYGREFPCVRKEPSGLFAPAGCRAWADQNRAHARQHD